MKNGVQRIDSVLIACPESVAATADVPISQDIKELTHCAACSEEVVCIHRLSNTVDDIT